jgi:hypothetical protein
VWKILPWYRKPLHQVGNNLVYRRGKGFGMSGVFTKISKGINIQLM